MRPEARKYYELDCLTEATILAAGPFVLSMKFVFYLDLLGKVLLSRAQLFVRRIQKNLTLIMSDSDNLTDLCKHIKACRAKSDINTVDLISRCMLATNK